MEWILLNIDELPSGEVLAGNFKVKTHGYKEKLIGYLGKDGDNIICDDGNTELHNCTHYINIHDFDPNYIK